MFQKIIKCAGLVLGLVAVQQAGAFTLWGPLEAWQTADLDYCPPGGVRYYYFNVDLIDGLGGTENGGTKDFGEGSRLTTPILTYGFDDTFLDYFGSAGVAAVDSAFAVLNALPSASSANLNNFLMLGDQQVNYTAQALDMLDIKSTVLWLMVEHMGLLGETHVWDLVLRAHDGTPTCDYAYFVINRNYDPVTYDPSAYVNGRLYNYFIWDGCSIGINVGDAIELPADASASGFTAVATPENLQLGGFYLGLTRDDMGGLQYLYSKGNYAYQSLDSNSLATPFTSDWTPVGTNTIAGITNFAGLLGGVEKISFVKVNYDSLLNPGFTPLTYNYTIPWVTNYRLSQLHVTRTVTAPDILFTAAKLLNSEALPNYGSLSRSGTFIQTTYVSPGGGVTPSTINPTTLIILNNVGPVFYNFNPYFMDSQDYIEYPVFNWGTFDGSTNAPILYPFGSSLAQLQSEALQGGASLPLYPWAPVNLTPTNTATPVGGGTGIGPGPSTASVH